MAAAFDFPHTPMSSETPPGGSDKQSGRAMLYDPTEHRIRSFVTRAGRLSTAQARALEELGPRFMLVHTPGVGSLLKQIGEEGLTNLRLIQHDAVEVLNQMIADASLAGVHVFFPDPWHKARHNKRRLLQTPFVKLLAEKLAPGGYLHCATDWEDYAVQMLEVLGSEPLLQNTADGYAPQPEYRPLTKFENRGIKLGHGVWDLVFIKQK
jgi:tRNA (guanine-N7-)-methyltransferase